MIIYNVTTKVDKSVATQWLQWLNTEHIPEVMKTNCFTSHRLVRILDIDDSDGPTYAIQYMTEKISDYQNYITHFAVDIRQKAIDKWGSHFIAFRTVMEVIH
jgi:hypothetical protein